MPGIWPLLRPTVYRAGNHKDWNPEPIRHGMELIRLLNALNSAKASGPALCDSWLKAHGAQKNGNAHLLCYGSRAHGLAP